MVTKTNGNWIPCGNFRRLNNVTVPDRYPFLNIQAYTTHLASFSIFSQVDVFKGYHQFKKKQRNFTRWLTQCTTSKHLQQLPRGEGARVSINTWKIRDSYTKFCTTQGDSLQGVSLQNQTGPRIDPLIIEPYKSGEDQSEIG
ncbi:unnamed protein product [Lepeophtheirus salmonis]|uniref:(salmon louse) hypothetical protein n=1 Tax=Lepeophtheirus salmonis TaxID=72036 RepID=A0A7R8H7N2_LEPSM|nr:unnamed protein product [Lepeophtheirus salmonis]CAF2924162.1 unnamed protein product [Lepeophtheirus salmonis]